MLHFATYFDSNYLARGLALLQSLKKYSSQSFTLYVLGLDEKVITFFQTFDYGNVITIPLKELERHFPELLDVKTNRSRIEYYFTLSPFLPLFILRKFPEIDRITTMDADILFFNDPHIIFGAYPESSILITPHNFSPSLKDSVKYGKYNVSFQSFKNDEYGLACLESWKSKCLDWCFDQLDEENNRFADQKYLDTWSQEFQNVTEINIPGAGLSPWNIEKFSYKIEGKKIFVNDHPLIYFHFHHLRIFNGYFAMNGLRDYKVKSPNKSIKLIYHTYLKTLSSTSNKMDLSENQIQRNNYVSGRHLLHNLLNTDGYWFFTRYFIMHLNPYRSILKIKNTFKKLHGQVNWS